MELLLNLVWLVIAVGTVVAWAVGWAQPERRRARNLLNQWIGLATVLVFLFFAISLTDDLQLAAAAAAGDLTAVLSDDVATNRRHGHVLVWDSAHSVSQNAVWTQGSLAPAPSLLVCSPNLEIVGQIAPAAFNLDCSVQASFLSGRAPPVSSSLRSFPVQ